MTDYEEENTVGKSAIGQAASRRSRRWAIIIKQLDNSRQSRPRGQRWKMASASAGPYHASLSIPSARSDDLSRRRLFGEDIARFKVTCNMRPKPHRLPSSEMTELWLRLTFTLILAIVEHLQDGYAQDPFGIPLQCTDPHYSWVCLYAHAEHIHMLTSNIITHYVDIWRLWVAVAHKRSRGNRL